MMLSLFVAALAASVQGVPGATVDPASVSLSGAEARHAVVHHGMDASGTHWLRGRSYKASAQPSGFAFHPFLGSDAPRNFPVAFRLVGASRGDRSIPLDDGARVSRSDDRIVLDRGAIQVRYDAAPDEVEQSFLLDVPAGDGALSLRLGVDTELAVEARGGGFQFRGELGGVDYGAATAFDAAGRSVEVPATWSHGEIHLTVPASFLAEATSPIVVDPILAAFTIAPLSADLDEPDAAYDLIGDLFCVVYEERFSGADVDVYSVFVASDGTVSGGAYVEQSTESWSGPSVAQNYTSRNFLIVAEAPNATLSPSRDIVARTRRIDGSFGPGFVMRSATPAFSCSSPTVGGDNVYQGSRFCVPYNRDYGTHSEVHAILTIGSPTGFLQFEQPLADSTSETASAPAMSKATGVYPGASWLIAWATRDLSTGESRVAAKAISYDGGTIYGPYSIAAPVPGAFYFDVDVSVISDRFALDGDRQYFLIAYDDRPSNVSDAFVALFDGAVVLDTLELQIAEHADRGPNQDNLVIATGPHHFMLGYLEDGSLYTTIVQPVGDKLGIVERRRVAVGSNAVHGSLAAVERVAESSGHITAKGLFLWSQTGGARTEIRGAFSTLPADHGAGGWQYCYGAPNSTGDYGFLQGLGSRIPGFAHRLRVEALPPSVFGYFLASTTTGLVPNPSGSQGTLCVGGTIGRFGVFQAGLDGVSVHTLDTDQIPQPTGSVMALSGQVWAFQVWYRDSSAGVATSNFTNGATLSFR